MIKVILNQDGKFETHNIEVISKEKNGKIISKDENKKPVYERIPAAIWATAEGNFNSYYLDKPKIVGGNFEIKTERDADTAKAILKQFATEYFEATVARCNERINVLGKQINENKLKLLQAAEALKGLKETEKYLEIIGNVFEKKELVEGVK